MNRHSKSGFLQVTLNFEIELINISSSHSNSNFALFLTCIALSILQ